MQRYSHTRLKRTFLSLVALFVALVATSCEREPFNQNAFTFHATIEQPGDTTHGLKTYLEKEQWVYWEYGDTISIGSDVTGGGNYTANLVSSSGSQNYEDEYDGVFVSEMPWSSQYFLGLFPYSENNTIVGSEGSAEFTDVKLELPSTQPLRNDFSFAKNVFPMVAWYGGHWDDQPGSEAYNLDFHSLGSIVRLQFINGSGTAGTINKVTVTSDSRQLCGMFNVKDFKTYTPYLEPAANTEANRTIVLDGANRAFGTDTICSFYLVLPATSSTATVDYELKVTLETSLGSWTGTFTANTRRNSISYLRAIKVNSWSPVSVVGTISGNGTEQRPFRVYTLEELKYIRQCYNAAGDKRYINNIEITPMTRIWIMRSDINLEPTTWDAGIVNFVGVMEDKSHSSNPGISTSSPNPLFVSIGEGGQVVGLTLKASTQVSTGAAFSPFCTANHGVIRNCHISTPNGAVIRSTNSDVAGLCVTNNNSGLIEGCLVDANFAAPGKKVGGICLDNHGYVIACQATSTMKVSSAATVGGICHTNSGGRVNDSYFSASIVGAQSQWGGVVFENSTGGRVVNCANFGTLTSGTKSIAGVVHTLTGGTVDYCYTSGHLQGSDVAGIVLKANGGTIRNCFIDDDTASVILAGSSEDSFGGGIVAYLNGANLSNCFIFLPHIYRTTTTGHVAGLVGKATAGTITNCYSYETATSGGSGYFVYASTLPASSITNCYLVGASQDGVTTKTTAEVATDEFTTLLNSVVNGDMINWTLSTNTPKHPVLVGAPHTY